MAIKRFFRRGSGTDAVAEVLVNGVAIIERLFEPDMMDRLLARVTPELDALDAGGGGWFGNAKRSVPGLFARGREFSEALLLNEYLLEVADGVLLPDFPMSARLQAREPEYRSHPIFEPNLLVESDVPVIDPRVGPNCHHYRVNASVAMQACPGGTHQQLHRDEWRYLPYLRRDPEGPELTVAFMVAATDFTTRNGATRFVPGSNRWERGRAPSEAEVVQAVMPKGSVAVWLGSVFHGMAANDSSEPRTGFLFSYVVDYLTQEENQFMTVPSHVAATLPRRAQQLLGYRASHGLNSYEGLGGRAHVQYQRDAGD